MIVTAFRGDAWKGVWHFLKTNTPLHTCPTWTENALCRVTLPRKMISFLYLHYPGASVSFRNNWSFFHPLGSFIIYSSRLLSISTLSLFLPNTGLWERKLIYLLIKKLCCLAVHFLDSCQSTQSLGWSIWNLKFFPWPVKIFAAYEGNRSWNNLCLTSIYFL